MINDKNTAVISGLNIRRFQGESDYPWIAAVITASEGADGAERKVTAEDVELAYQRISNCDPYRDIVIAEVADEMIGYARGWWVDESSEERLYKHNGYLSPAWRRKGIGSILLLWIENRLREVATSHPPETEKIFQVSALQNQKGTAMLLERSGYQPIRYFYEMARPTLDDIPEFPLPDGVEIRPASPDNYRAIWQSADETSQDEWGYTIPSEEDYQEWISSPQFQPDLWQIAWDPATDRVVGHVLTYIHHDENKQFNRRRGYTEGIGVVRSWRGHGLARALIARSLQAQKAAGMTESVLVADSDSKSNVTRLYESCGFQIINCSTIFRKPI